MITTRKATSMVEAFPVFQNTTCSSTPRPIPAANARGSDSILATTAAASAGSRSVGPPNAVDTEPAKGAFMMAVKAARPPEMIHTKVESRWMGMPNSKARSRFSAAARTAAPESVRRRNHASAAMTGGTEATIRRWSPVKRTGSMLKPKVNGVRKPPTSPAEPNRRGMINSMPPRTCANPMVATVSTKRDESAKRRMTSTSTSPPTASPTARPIAAATRYGRWASR